jgi:hypothetical protein
MHLPKSGPVQERLFGEVLIRPDSDARTRQICRFAAILLSTSGQWYPGVVSLQILLDCETRKGLPVHPFQSSTVRVVPDILVDSRCMLRSLLTG